MKNGALHEYGHLDSESVTLAWDEVQKRVRIRFWNRPMCSQFVCCGLDSEDIWTASEWFLHQEYYPKSRVPTSCCPTCVNIHDRLVQFHSPSDLNCSRFCGSFFTAGDNQSLSQQVCLAASELCSSANQLFADIDACLGRKVMAPAWPRGAFINDKAP